MKKRILSLLCVLALCLGLLPVTALAAGEDAPDKLYVGNQSVRNGNSTTYWTTNDSGELTQSSANDAWSVKYEPGTATLTLKGATIDGGEYSTTHYGAGIYAQCSSNQSVTLTIELIGTNTITGNYGIYVEAERIEESRGTDASLTIMGNGCLEVSGSSYGISVKSGTGNASLTINNASVKANTTNTANYYAGVYVMSSSNATGSPKLSLAVNGGSLTASGGTSSDGIQFYVGDPDATNAITSLTVSGNAIVDARTGGIKATRVSTDLPTPKPTGENSSGIVFDGTEGTVYGDVTLEEDLEIGEGETLTIPEGSSLTSNSNLTNNGTINVEDGGKLEGEPGGTIVSAPTITTESLPEGTVNQSYNAELKATGNNITWSSSDLPTWLTLDADTGTISGAPTNEGNYKFTVKASNSAGSYSKEYTLNIKPATVPVTGVSLNKNALSLTVDGTDTLTATVTPENATNKAVTWESSNTEVATVDNNGKVTALKPGTATITATAGGKSATCTVTVSRKPVIPDPNGITVTQPANGTIKVNPSNGSAGTLITVTATPDEGYELAYITVDGEKITGNTFRMPDKAVTVSAVFVPETFPFVDVKTGDWFYDYVAYVYSNGLMDGTSATTFEPNANMTRAMVWAILARIDGETVTGAAWATDARAWAMAEGVSDGTDPNGLVTREQFATMLYRYAVAQGYDVSIGESTNILSYADFGQISEWAIPAMQWACGSSVITGVTDSTLAPQGTATRAQCAAMLMRFVEL